MYKSQRMMEEYDWKSMAEFHSDYFDEELAPMKNYVRKGKGLGFRTYRNRERYTWRGVAKGLTLIGSSLLMLWIAYKAMKP